MRISSANCGSVWSQTFSYDAFGNISKSGSASFSALYSSSTNRITSVGSFTPTYDADGHILTDPAHNYTWDFFGNPITIDSVGLTNDAFGRMVEQNRSGVFTQFVYSPQGGKLAIMSGQTLVKAFVKLPGGAQAVYGPSGILYYGHSDHLGSIRVGSTSPRTVSFDVAYAPFGETYAASGATDPDFTGQRQDTVSGVYDFPAREYSNEGRWASPDPSGISAFHLPDPQSINGYVYARNTPLSIVDPTGLDGCDATDSGTDGGGATDALSPARGRRARAMNRCAPIPVDPVTVDVPLTSDDSQTALDLNDYAPGQCDDNGCYSAAPISTTTEEPGDPDQATPNAVVPASEAANLSNQAQASLSLVPLFYRAVHPFEVTILNGFIIYAGIAHVQAGVLVIIGGCADPTPAEPLTCGAGITAGTAAITTGGAIIVGGIIYFANQTIPAWQNWGKKE